MSSFGDKKQKKLVVCLAYNGFLAQTLSIACSASHEYVDV